MDFKKKLRNFISLTAKAREGFTLVELIVVIAILAILAGVAIPAYTGYIKRAEEAKDQLLIAAINEAFAGGCLEAGIEVGGVTEATISVVAQKVFSISSVAPTTTAQLDTISSTFNQLFQGNFDTAFVTENVLSLRWVAEDHSFVMDHENSVPSRVILSSGKAFTVSPEKMAMIEASTYADLGYAVVAGIVDELGASSETMCGWAKSLGMIDKFTNVMSANGLLASGIDPDSLSAEEAANGLQMVTAKYLAGASQEDIDYLLNEVDFKLGGMSMLTNIVAGESGTKTVAAAALQFALVEGFANNDEFKNATITVKEGGFLGLGGKDVTYTISDYLASEGAKEDPVAAMSKVQNTDAYKQYMTTEQYTNDINGFVGTMSLLGDNLGTVSNPGAVDIDEYFKEGIHSQDAADALTAVLGK